MSPLTIPPLALAGWYGSPDDCSLCLLTMSQCSLRDIREMTDLSAAARLFASSARPPIWVRRLRVGQERFRISTATACGGRAAHLYGPAERRALGTRAHAA